MLDNFRSAVADAMDAGRKALEELGEDESSAQFLSEAAITSFLQELDKKLRGEKTEYGAAYDAMYDVWEHQRQQEYDEDFWLFDTHFRGGNA